jgi:hypothetical protein
MRRGHREHGGLDFRWSWTRRWVPRDDQPSADLTCESTSGQEKERRKKDIELTLKDEPSVRKDKARARSQSAKPGGAVGVNSRRSQSSLGYCALANLVGRVQWTVRSSRSNFYGRHARVAGRATRRRGELDFLFEFRSAPVRKLGRWE